MEPACQNTFVPFNYDLVVEDAKRNFLDGARILAAVQRLFLDHLERRLRAAIDEEA